MHRNVLLTALALLFGVSNADGGMILSGSFDVLRLDLACTASEQAGDLGNETATSAGLQSVSWEFAEDSDSVVLTFTEGDVSSMSGIVAPLLGAAGQALASSDRMVIPTPAILGRVIVSNSVLPGSPVLDGLIKPS